MKLKELENAINEKVKDIKNSDNYNIVWEVRRIVSDLLKDYKDILYVGDYKNEINIRISGNCYGYRIVIKIRKKIVGKDYKSWYSKTIYKIDKVEVQESDEFDSIEGFIEYCNKREEEKENYEKRKLDKFESKLSDINIDFKMFYDMMEEYRNLSYDNRQELAKKYAGKDYYRYY